MLAAPLQTAYDIPSNRILVAALVSAFTTLPVSADGKRRFVYMALNELLGDEIFIQLGGDGVVATAATGMRMRPEAPLVLDVSSTTHIAIINDTSNTAAQLHMSALENHR